MLPVKAASSSRRGSAWFVFLIVFTCVVALAVHRGGVGSRMMQARLSNDAQRYLDAILAPGANFFLPLSF